MKEGLLLIRLVESFYGNLLPKILVVGGGETEKSQKLFNND